MRVNISSINFKQRHILKPINKSNGNKSLKPETKSSASDVCILSPVCPIKKANDIDKLKKKLIQAYDLIFEDMALEAKEMGINFVKPKLVFKPLNKKMHAWYITGKNEIEINSKMLEAKGISRYNDGTYFVEGTVNGKEIPSLDFVYSSFAKRERNAIYIEDDEKLYLLAGTLKHELTHARQEQIMLSGEKSLERLYLTLKNKYPVRYKKVSFEIFKTLLPFYSHYKPSKTFEGTKKFTFIYPNTLDSNGKPIEISYSPNDIADLKVNYTTNDCEKYYTDLMEIEARAEQTEFFLNYKKYLPNIDIPEETIDYYVRCLQYICQVMLQK